MRTSTQLGLAPTDTPWSARSLRVLWALAALAIFGLWLWGLAHTPLAVHETVPYYLEPIGEIRGGQTVGQTVLAPYNGLYRIDVALADYGRLNTGPITFRLKRRLDVSDSVNVQAFPADTVRGDVTRAFEFAPLPDSAGKTYYFQLEAANAVPGNAITTYLRPIAPYPVGTAYRAGHPVQGDLVFSLYFKVGLGERIKILLQQMTEHKPFLWGDWRFYAGIVVIYVMLLAALARQLGQVLNQTETEGDVRQKD